MITLGQKKIPTIDDNYIEKKLMQSFLHNPILPPPPPKKSQMIHPLVYNTIQYNTLFNVGKYT